MRHVTVEVVEVAKLLSLCTSISVSRVVTLVVLDVNVDTLLLSEINQLLVLLEDLDSGLGDHDMDAALNGVLCDGEVGRVGGEDCDGIARLESVNGGLVSVGVDLVVFWE